MNNYTWNLNSADCLVHYGTKGMQWGIRRYQNQDGTYTALGRKRRAQSSGRGRSSKNWSEDHRNAHTRKRMSEMTTKELQARNQRLQAEKQYRELTSKSSKNKNDIGNIVLNRILIPAITGMAISRIQKYGGKYLDKAIEPWIAELDKKLEVD